MSICSMSSEVESIFERLTQDQRRMVMRRPVDLLLTSPQERGFNVQSLFRMSIRDSGKDSVAPKPRTSLVRDWHVVVPHMT